MSDDATIRTASQFAKGFTSGTEEFVCVTLPPFRTLVRLPGLFGVVLEFDDVGVVSFDDEELLPLFTFALLFVTNVSFVAINNELIPLV